MSQKEFFDFSTNTHGIFDNLRKKPRNCSKEKPVKVNWSKIQHVAFTKPESG